MPAPTAALKAPPVRQKKPAPKPLPKSASKRPRKTALKRRKRYAVVGTGGRCRNFIDPLIQRYGEVAELVAFCDISQVRMDATNRRLVEMGHPAVPTFKGELAAFRRMLRQTYPDAIFVTSMDSTHHDYIVEGVRQSLEIITEKPMTTDAAKCKKILSAVKRYQGNVRVTFNYRWINWCTAVKQALVDGAIGNVLSVNLEYLLDTSHGADYYRRWHSHMDCSGGLLVHKSTHHFDLVNWWIDGIAEEVFAHARLAFYGQENALQRGQKKLTRYPRYTGKVKEGQDPFMIDLTRDATLKELYYDAEAETGYLRDQNVFRPGIDIYDSMSVNVRYRSGILLTYSLNSFCPREGMRVTFNGDRGRLEFYEFGGSHIIKGQSSEQLAQEQQQGSHDHRITVYPMHAKEAYTITPPKAVAGGHGGSDTLLGEQIFLPKPPKDTLHRNAGHEQGAASILIGIAANESIANGLPVRPNDLCKLQPKALRLSELA
ncbi:MAG: Gfo/Idh/MocA family protein [Opitutales bacterium]